MNFQHLATILESDEQHEYEIRYVRSGVGGMARENYPSLEDAQRRFDHLVSLKTAVQLCVDGVLKKENVFHIQTGQFSVEDADVDEDTTEQAISYLPSQIGTVKAQMKRLARQKADWKIDVLESVDGYSVRFEDGPVVHIPGNYWSEFQSIMDSKLSSPTTCLRHFLVEAEEDEQDWKLKGEFQTALNTFFARQPFQAAVMVYESFRRYWPKGSAKAGESIALPLEDYRAAMERIKSEVAEAYGDDRGGLEMLVDSLNSGGRGLMTFDGFKGYDFLYGTRYDVRDIGVLEVLVDPTLKLVVTVEIHDPELLDAVVEAAPKLKYVGPVLYPHPDLTSASQLFKTIKGVYEDHTSPHPEEGKGEEHAPTR